MEEYRAGIHQTFKISWPLTQLTAVSADLLPRVSGRAWHSEIARSVSERNHERYYCPAEVPVLNSHPSYRDGVCGCVLLYISVRITYLIAYLFVIHLTHNFVCYEILHKHKKNNDKICVDYNICS